jgi:hypothetical protein
VNFERESQATHQLPATLLEQEKAHLGKLPPNAQDYGLFESLVVNREGMVTYQTNRYSVPASLLGQTLTARIHRQHIKLYDDGQLVADHRRCFERNRRMVVPEHFEKVFEVKPRGRTMVYRDWLLALSPVVYNYVYQLCRKQRSKMNEQVQALYQLAQQLGREEFGAAVELAMEQGLFGAEYVKAIAVTPVLPCSVADQKEKREKELMLLASPAPEVKPVEFELNTAMVELTHYGPHQQEVERELSFYEGLVANRNELELAGISASVTTQGAE